MSKLSLFDLHSDTATALYYGKKDFLKNDLHIALDKIGVYQNYAQVFAVFTSPRLSDDDGYAAFLKVSDFFRSLLDRHADRISFADSADDLTRAWRASLAAAFFAVEDARILGGKRERIEVLREHGVRFLTLTWAGETCIGGSWDTSSGLTAFGKETVRDAFRLGIVPDVSHASVRSTDDTLAIAEELGRPIVATHSDAFSVYGHNRNLTDEHFERIKRLGGLVGINLYKAHLADDAVAPADVETVYRHIEHYMSLGGENTVSFGCDFDGADFPADFSDVASVERMAEVLLSHNYSEELVRNIFWRNAEAFVRRNF